MAYIEDKKMEWSGNKVDQRTRDRSNYVAGPSASPNILKKYEELLKFVTKDKSYFSACVFGATPELRDLVLELGGALTTVDISEEMIAKCSQLMRYKDHPRETVVIDNWLDNDLPAESFDVVLGDGVSNNAGDLTQQKIFFEKIKNILKPGGYHVGREGVKDENRKSYSAKEVGEDFLSGKIHWFDVFVNLCFYWEKRSEFYNESTGKSETKKFWNRLEQEVQKGEFDRQAWEIMSWFRGDLVHTLFPRQFFDKLYQNYFEMLPIEQVSDYLFTRDSLIFYLGRVKK